MMLLKNVKPCFIYNYFKKIKTKPKFLHLLCYYGGEGKCMVVVENLPNIFMTSTKFCSHHDMIVIILLDRNN